MKAWSRAILLWSLLGAALLSCMPSLSPTQLTLTINSDLSVPSEIDRVTISVVGQDLTEDPEADLRQKALPRAITLLHESGPLGPVQISVRGWLGSQMVVQKEVVAWFVPTNTTALHIDLSRACQAVLCAQGQTCSEGACGPIASPLDGGTSSFGSDGAVHPSDADTGAVGADGAVLVDADTSGSDGAVDGDSGSDGSTAGDIDGGLDAGSAHDAGPTPADAGQDAGAVAQDAGSDAGGAGSVDAGPPPPPPPPSAGLPPVCSISLPTAGDTYQVNVALQLAGSCTDPETGALSQGITWQSQLDGVLGNAASLSVPLRTAGAHTLSLCATDPRDVNLRGCASVAVTASATAQPSVAITGITQSGSNVQPFSTAQPIVFTGVGTGASVSLTWTDDLQGALGTGASVSLSAPLVGRHTVALQVRDRQGVQQTVTRAYLVVAVGESNLISALPNVNVTLDQAGDPAVPMIAADPLLRVYVPNSSGPLYRFDGAALASPAVVAIGQPPLRAVAQDVYLALDKNLSYVATADGLSVCTYSAASGATEPCTAYTRGFLPSQNLRSVLRMVDSRSVDSLLVGTDNGLFLPDNVIGSNRGTTLFRGRVIRDMVALSGRALVATDSGLYVLTPSTQQSQRFSTTDGLPSNQLTSLALGSDGSAWIGTSSGLVRDDLTTNRMSVWNTGNGLSSNAVNGVAVQRVTLASVARDVVWVATSNGVTRLDTLSGAITRFSTADGLPSNDVLAVQVLANGTKLFGTARGLGHYLGP